MSLSTSGSAVRDLPAMKVDGVRVHLVQGFRARTIIAGAADHCLERPLAVASINLDHLHHFGASRPDRICLSGDDSPVDWLNLIDGTPIAHHAERVTGSHYPKLSGSDLVVRVLEDCSLRDRSVGVLGGSPEVTAALRARFAGDWPGIRFAGHWTPPRSALDSAANGGEIASEIAEHDVDILLVCLGKPRQEAWIDEFGATTGAGALLAFGAVVDFLAGRVSRAPEWVSRSGMEWAWRLAHEPRRLAHRYLIDGPPAYVALRRSSAA
jgi:exopolysaccharide biosynthesis WecB/TagA/CpsF family protein